MLLGMGGKLGPAIESIAAGKSVTILYEKRRSASPPRTSRTAAGKDKLGKEVTAEDAARFASSSRRPSS